MLRVCQEHAGGIASILSDQCLERLDGRSIGKCPSSLSPSALLSTYYGFLGVLIIPGR